MINVNKILKEKPEWLQHEGKWRLLQVLQLVPLVALWGAAVLTIIFDGNAKAVLILMLLGALGLLGVHYAAFLMTWVRQGYKAPSGEPCAAAVTPVFAATQPTACVDAAVVPVEAVAGASLTELDEQVSK